MLTAMPSLAHGSHILVHVLSWPSCRCIPAITPPCGCALGQPGEIPAWDSPACFISWPAPSQWQLWQLILVTKQ